ncbi:hypothetical protein [Afipia clevelandensis]|uniref:Uncharacterized protein n=1 Tax=Afipia clevelandensis ATCC 49720 TaxID=883079 RepID=K8P5D4_9BRAD|nr:hypothetical protein [Afipia clevelandensis]EKS37757.1 hypothetical protein HMPREF9696_01707 [Afipia clevelandensis ATCC 49720]
MAIAPLQIPGYATPQSLDFSSLANLGQVYKKAEADRGLRDAFANGVPTDAQGLAQLGAQVGAYNPQLGLSLAQLGMTAGQRQQEQERQARLDQRQTSRDAVDDRFREESLRLQKAAAARANEDKPLIKEVTDPNTGATSFVRINPRTGELSPLGSPMPASQPNNPFGGGKFNEGQGKAAGFTDRMLQSEGILSGVGDKPGVQDQGSGLAGAWGGAMEAAGNAPYVGGVVGALTNNLKGADRQKYEQAKRDFINAQLRRESGAAISPSEFDSANKQYFPSVGDSAEVIAQKAANRRAAVEAMGREGGPSYKPKYTFDESGRVVPYGKKPSGNVTSSGVKWSIE